MELGRMATKSVRLKEARGPRTVVEYRPIRIVFVLTRRRIRRQIAADRKPEKPNLMRGFPDNCEMFA